MGEDHPNSKRVLVLETIRAMALSGEPITNSSVQTKTGVGRETIRTYLQALRENKYLKKDNGCFECPNPNALFTFTNEDRPYRRQKSRSPRAPKVVVKPLDLPPVAKTLEDLLSYVAELEERVIYLEEENKGLFKQFNDVHQALATRAYNPRVILPAMPDHS